MRQLYTTTNDIGLASALLALGIPPVEDQPYFKTKNAKGNDQFIFQFQLASTCGNYKTQEMINAWYDTDFHIKEPEHPFAYIKCAFGNREGLLDLINKDPGMVVVKQHGKIAIVSKEARESVKDFIINEL